MKKYLLIKKCENNLFVGVVSNKRFIYTAVEELSSNSFSISSYIKKIKRNTGIKTLYLALCIDDKKCFYKFDSKDIGKINRKDIPSNFYEYISDEVIDDYKYDYMYLDINHKTNNNVLYCAALKSEIEKLIELSNDIGIRLRKIVPETIAIGNVIKYSNTNNYECVIVGIGFDEVSIKIFHGNHCVAKHEIEDGLGKLNEIFIKNDISIFDRKNELHKKVLKTKEAKNAICKIIVSIVRTMDFYRERNICSDESSIYITGVGATIGTVIKTLRANTHMNCIGAYEMVSGNASIDVASMLFEEYGAVLER